MHSPPTNKGRAVCDCPSGWTLDPVQERQCLDVDECATEGLSDCQFSCVNTLGSYKCVPSADYGTAADQPVIEQVLSCPPGRSFNSSTGICEGTCDRVTLLCFPRDMNGNACLSLPQMRTSAKCTTEAALMSAQTQLGASIVPVGMDLSSLPITSLAWVSLESAGDHRSRGLIRRTPFPIQCHCCH